MHVMRCPDCGVENPVSRDYCRACNRYLWPQCQPQGIFVDHQGGDPPPARLGGAARRFLRHLFRSD